MDSSNRPAPDKSWTALSIPERQARLVAEFAALPDWEARYKRVIEMGKKIPPAAPELHDEKYKVRGCQSQVWLHARLAPVKNAGDSTGLAIGESAVDSRPVVILEADSDAMIVKGLVAVLLKVYSEARPEEILKASPQFLKELGFESHLSPSRANGLYAMLKQILLYAHAFQALASS